MNQEQLKLEFSGNILRGLVSRRMSIDQMCAEWIDNALDAGARSMSISWKPEGLFVKDDGCGTDDLVTMESFGKSGPPSHGAFSVRSSTYGMGGVQSQAIASNHGVVEITSKTANMTCRMTIDFGICIRTGKFEAVAHDRKSAKNQKTGTTIHIHTPDQPADYTKLVAKLGYLYGPAIRDGFRLTVSSRTADHVVHPYVFPEAEREIRGCFTLSDGSSVSFHCMKVKAGHPNPHYGFNIKLNHRYIGRFHEPAGDQNDSRIFAVVDLDEQWRNRVEVTKDKFSVDPKELFDALAEQCREIIEMADVESQDLQLRSMANQLQDALGKALGVARGIKGVRDGDAGKSGTEESTGEGSPHRRFRKSQEGPKQGTPAADARQACDTIRVTWNSDIEGSFQGEFVGARGRTFQLCLNPDAPFMSAFRKHRDTMIPYCILIMAHLLASNGDIQGGFSEFKNQAFDEIYESLIRNVSGPESENQEEQAA